MLSRGKQPNLSFFAFTATPKAKTLEVFGRKSDEDNKPRPFHLYSIIAQKTQVIVEHFRHNVRHRIQGQAKAMVVTSSRLHAVKYKQAFDKYIAEQGYDDIKTLVAFSGTVVDEAGLSTPSLR
jgi:hypothetical protein